MIQKKGQLTALVIIGIVVVAAVAIFFLVPNSRIADTQQTTEEFDSQISSFVEDCISLLGIEAFKKLGENGGYINLSFSQKPLTLRSQHTESDVLTFSSNKIPYWWYLKTPNRCQDCYLGNNIPSLGYIEFQVERYLENNLDSCLRDFKDFNNLGVKVEKGNANATVNIAAEDVEIRLDLPVRAETSEFSRLESFRTRLDIRFKELYELAFNLTKKQAEEQYLENITMAWIGVYGAADPSKIPPVAWVDHEPSKVTWTVEDVHRKIRDYVLPNVALIQVENTQGANLIQTGDKYQDGVYNMMFLSNKKQLDGVSVNFIYDPEWDMYFNIWPRSGNLLQPSSYRTDFPLGNLPTFYSNTYEFFYDISFPVAVVLRDSKSLKKFENDGYSFIFSLEANIRGNKNLYEWNQGRGVVGGSPSQGNITRINGNVGTCTRFGSQFRCSLDLKTYDSEIACGQACIDKTPVTNSFSQTQTLFCNENQRISKELSLDVRDSAGNPVNGVIVNYGCGTHAECAVGKTANGRFSSKLPLCIGGGFLRIEKEGYATKFIKNITTDLNNPVSISATLERIKQASVNIKVIELINMFRFKQELDSYIGTANQIALQFKQSINSMPPSMTDGQRQILRNSVYTDFEALIAQARILLVGMQYPNQVNDQNVVDAALKLKEAFEKIPAMISDTYVYDVLDDASDPIYIPNLSLKVQPSQESAASSALISIEDKLKNLRTRTSNNDHGKSFYLSQAREMKDSENASVSVFSGSWSKTAIITKAGSTMDLTPGHYDVTIFMTDNSLPDLNVISGSSVPLSSTPIGFAVINNNNKKWDVPSSPSSVTFYVLRVEPPANTNELQELGNVEKYSSIYRDIIEPEVS